MTLDGLKVVLRVNGASAERLIERLHDLKIYAKDVVLNKNDCFFTVERKDLRKIFAICRNMCYNIEKVKYTGRFSLVYRLAKNVGAVLGAFAFVFFAYSTDRVVAEIDFGGEAKGYRREITAVLAESGVRIGEKCIADLSTLGEKVSLSVDGLAYATVEKRGKRVVVYAKGESFESEVIDVKRSVIIAPVDGEVKKINALSGTVKVGVGDFVKAGDVLIDGKFVDASGKEISTYALGEICLATEVKYVYEAKGKGEQYARRAEALAEESVGDGEILERRVIFSELNGKFTYTAIFSVVTIVG